MNRPIAQLTETCWGEKEQGREAGQIHRIKDEQGNITTGIKYIYNIVGGCFRNFYLIKLEILNETKEFLD